MDGPLSLDATAVRAAMAAAGDQDVVKTFVKLAILADLDDEEIEALRNEAAKRSGISKRTITRMLRTALHELAAERQREAQERALAERSDPRPRVDVPDANAPWLAVMAILDEVISASSDGHPTAPRGIKGHGAFTGKRMSIEECAEMIERHVAFVDKNGRLVHLPTRFVRQLPQALMPFGWAHRAAYARALPPGWKYASCASCRLSRHTTAGLALGRLPDS